MLQLKDGMQSLDRTKEDLYWQCLVYNPKQFYMSLSWNIHLKSHTAALQIQSLIQMDTKQGWLTEEPLQKTIVIAFDNC